MSEVVVVLAFCAMLFVSVARGWSIIPALLAGMALFVGYGLVHGRTLTAMARRAVGSVRAAGMILVTFALIGMMTSLWRASGTIAFIVAHASTLIHGVTVVPLTFLLCSAMSVLVGSSFASAATMGVICMSLGLSMGAGPVLLGGAVLAGVYVGDRFSPVSTSALLVAQLTHTNLFSNLGRMLRTGAAPFALSCVFYAATAVYDAASGSGTMAAAGSGGIPIAGLFAKTFDLHWFTVTPAVLVIVMALLRADVRVTMMASIVVSAVVCVGVQRMAWRDLAWLVVAGYHAGDPRVGALLDGGGAASMVNVAVIVCISSAYAGIFAETRMLDRLRLAIDAMGAHIGAAGATVMVASCAAVVSCNQTLTIMLAHQLGAGLYGDDEDGRGEQAIDLEDSAVVIAPLVPWSIAGAVPLATIGAPTVSIVAATFLYLLPVTRLIGSAVSSRRRGTPGDRR
ncbi:Na+/H+ antiporter NhaC family protein [Bifidobacterium platyrrhinorum]|uniref:Sodium:proton antiporter n=1 Tax=Bifidobacterium platyrrhinorum TaxID=2661628 RepID=A0A6L9SP06_9BIFI|nr:Na+/H+ antiporter NhaC family protein [Bifidobacterium platyrrhinorum]NEG54276.1 sodium:proton antiporter [Bifidobacterium platyrrhinorum]